MSLVAPNALTAVLAATFLVIMVRAAELLLHERIPRRLGYEAAGGARLRGAMDAELERRRCAK
jgi:hypothetical protein